MECNKDEASRAKEIAEKNFLAKNIRRAKKYVLKAQNLYPGLEGMTQLKAAVDVYVAAENKINGELDCYGILGVDPLADDYTVRQKYRRLALLLHPDKNKSTTGADGAFKLVSEAWSLVHDKEKRAAYDQRTNRNVLRGVSIPVGSMSKAPGPTDSYNFAKSRRKVHRNTTQTAHSSVPASSLPPKPNTFWTVCHKCKIQYEYLRVYHNHNLLCPNCCEPFLAVETAPPPVDGSKTFTSWKFSQQQNSDKQAANKNTFGFGSNVASSNGPAGFSVPDSSGQLNFRWSPFSKKGASSVSQVADLVQQAYAKVKRQREEAQAATRRDEALKRKNHASRTEGASSTGLKNSSKRMRGVDFFQTNNHENSLLNQRGQVLEECMTNVTRFKPYNVRDTTQAEIHALLLQKAKVVIKKKMNAWSSARGMGNNKINVLGDKSSMDPKAYKCGSPLHFENGIHGVKCYPGTSGTVTEEETLRTISLDVTDPEFYNFDKDRTERCFGRNQVWAAYDNNDGMPRYYALIHSVISLDPFKIRISWLTSTNIDLGSLHLIGSGLSKSCGDFRMNRFEVYGTLFSFSHKVRWIKGTHEVFRIYPRKGEVWALYRNWSSDWNELTANEVIHKYEMVEVLEDYSEEHGAVVIPLIKVAGFKTIFHRHLNVRELRRIPGQEMFRFSHQVPAHLLAGKEGQHAPKGCWELDPAATPLDLLQVVRGDKEVDCFSECGKMKMKESCWMMLERQ